MQMKLFDRKLDTVLESGEQTTPLRPQPSLDPAGATKTYVPQPQSAPAANNQWGTMEQWQELEQMREKAKADKIAALTVDQKIELALKQAEAAERIAYRTSGMISSLDGKIDRAFQSLTQMINRIVQGKPATEPAEPGSSIFDDGNDPESIM